MTSPLDAAAQFCLLVRKPHLPAYVGMDQDAPAEQLREALADRRRNLQGMLHNPKHQQEARFLVQNGALLEQALVDLPQHLDDMRVRTEARHLPAIRMMLSGLLATGPIAPSRLERLREGALALGVRGSAFDDVYAELSRTTMNSASRVTPAPLPPPPEGRGLYDQLGAPPARDDEDLDQAFLASGQTAQSDAEKRRLQIAYRVLAHPGARARYDALVGTASPPSGVRTVRPVAGGIQVVGPRIRELPRNGPDVIKLTGRLPGTSTIASISADVPWLVSATATLDLGAAEPQVRVFVEERKLPWMARSGRVRVTAGEHSAQVEYRAPHFMYRVRRTLNLS